jgi:hypothetical protein
LFKQSAQLPADVARSIADRNKSKLEAAQTANLAKRLPAGATETDLGLVKAYQTLFGEALLNDDQTYNIPGMSAAIRDFATKKETEKAEQATRAAQIKAQGDAKTYPTFRDVPASITEVKPLAPFASVIPGADLAGIPVQSPRRVESVVRSIWTDPQTGEQRETETVINPNDPMALADLEAKEEATRLAAAKGGPSAEDAAKAAKVLATEEQYLNKLEAASKIVNDGKVNPVGPMVGNKISAWLVKAAAALGHPGAESVYDSQTKLTMFINEDVLKRVDNMKGALSNNDVIFLKGMVPKLESNEAVWNTYIATQRSFIEEARNIRAAGGDPTKVDIHKQLGLKPAADPSTTWKVTNNKTGEVLEIPRRPAGFLEAQQDGMFGWAKPGKQGLDSATFVPVTGNSNLWANLKVKEGITPAPPAPKNISQQPVLPRNHQFNYRPPQPQ